MGIVHTDTESLLMALRNMRMAISSIEETKRSLSHKYQQLGQQWSDKNYKELGDVLRESNKAFNQILSTLQKGEKYVSELTKSIQEYETITLGTASEQGTTAGDPDATRSAVGAGGILGLLSSIVHRKKNIRDALKGVEHKPIVPASGARTEQEIISSISGGDMTEGSCSSLALAYAGNRAGYVVFDFRDGQSRDVFSSRSTIEQIAQLDGVNSVIQRGKDDTVCAEQLMSHMERGREYYMATGAHAAVVRCNNEGRYQYLELQSGVAGENGWRPLTQEALYSRFGCEDGQNQEYANYLIELDSLQNNEEFLDLLGYINTDEALQRRGASGHVR